MINEESSSSSQHASEGGGSTVKQGNYDEYARKENYVGK
jgi:hypothetical protein